jgi:hypothetical protein
MFSFFVSPEGFASISLFLVIIIMIDFVFFVHFGLETLFLCYFPYTRDAGRVEHYSEGTLLYSLNSSSLPELVLSLSSIDVITTRE